MEIIKSFWEGMTNVCACVYMVDMCLLWSEAPAEGIASILPPGQRKKNEMQLKLHDDSENQILGQCEG